MCMNVWENTEKMIARGKENVMQKGPLIGNFGSEFVRYGFKGGTDL